MVLDSGVLVLSRGQAFILNHSPCRAEVIIDSFSGGEYIGESFVGTVCGESNSNATLPILLPQDSGAVPNGCITSDNHAVQGGDFTPSDCQLPALPDLSTTKYYLVI